MDGHEFKAQERDKAIEALTMMKELEKKKANKMKRATITVGGGCKVAIMATDMRRVKQLAKQMNGDLII